jgi:endonuclease III
MIWYHLADRWMQATGDESERTCKKLLLHGRNVQCAEVLKLSYAYGSTRKEPMCENCISKDCCSELNSLTLLLSYI